ncbi:hypothetical protein H0X09_01990 [Candidatus Saccharibacteria bacterium]|nr:hypothetical protein [Candidatus Saccharibacteria bacterium]
MSEFIPKSLCISGRIKALGVAELESLYGAKHIKPIEQAVLLDIETNEIEFQRLGGTVKLARILEVLPTTKWPVLEKYFIKNIPYHLEHLPNGTFTLGLSVYGLATPVQTITRSLMKIKKEVRATGRSMRIVPNKTPGLNSAQVLHNKLTSRGGWELLLVKHGNKTILAQTLFVQDIEAYAARDQTRPKRDAKVGMLPPKLAQIIINLATPTSDSTILDPFCGSGVVLQEAILMGYAVVGTDIEPRMVDYSKSNLEWLNARHPDQKFKTVINVADATKYRWAKKFETVASEIYLGTPFHSLPAVSTLNKIIHEVDSLLLKFLKNIGSQIDSGFTLSLAIPAWRLADGRLAYLPILDRLTDIGYNYLDFKHAHRQQLIYFREGQVVARQIIVIRKA